MTWTQADIDSGRLVLARVFQELQLAFQVMNTVWDGGILKQPDGTFIVNIQPGQKTQLVGKLSDISTALPGIKAKLDSLIAAA